MDIFQLAPSIVSGDTTFKFDFDAVVKEYIEKNPSKSSGLAAEIGERFAEFLELLVTLKSLVDSGVPINNITSLTENETREALGLPKLLGFEFVPFVAKIDGVDGNKLTINKTWSEYIDLIGLTDFPENETRVLSNFDDVKISQQINNKRALNTYLHFGDDNILLSTNSITDKVTVPEYPHSTVFKLYEPLPDEINEKDNVYIVQEVLPELVEEVELIPYAQEEEDVTVLRTVESSQVSSPVSMRRTELKSYNDLITTDTKLQESIIDKYLSGSNKPVELNVDYSNYENFINFSSAEKRLENFKYKIQQIESYTQQSSSLVGVTNSEKDLQRFDKLIRDTKNNFDGYETYLYNVSSSYVSSSMGIFPDASWPKTGSGTYADPFVPVSSSDASFTSWYGSVNTELGQVYTASLYDTDNQNRLVNLLPQHIREDIDNSYFLDFMDMVGQHFDELWAYIKVLLRTLHLNRYVCLLYLTMILYITITRQIVDLPYP